LVATIVGAVLLILGLGFYGYPRYTVYEQSFVGQAELAKAEFNRRIAVLEAQARQDSAKMLAEAEVMRAEGVAKAN